MVGNILDPVCCHLMDGDVSDPADAAQINCDVSDPDAVVETVAVRIICGENFLNCQPGEEWIQCKR